MAFETRKGTKERYFYLAERVGSKVKKTYLGPADSPMAQAGSLLVAEEAQESRLLRTVNEEFRAADTALRRFLSEIRSLIEFSLSTCGYQNDGEGHWRLRRTPGRPFHAALTLRERFADELVNVSAKAAVNAEEAAISNIAKLICHGDHAQVEECLLSLQEQASAAHEQDMLAVEKLLMTAVVLGDAFASICDQREIARSRRGDHGAAALKLLQRFQRHLERPAGRG